MAVGRPGATSYAALGGFAVNVAATLTLTDALGITGPALGLLVGSLFQVGVGFLITRPILDIDYFRLWPAWEIVALLAAYAATLATGKALERILDPAIALALGFLACPLAFAVTFIAMGGVRPEDGARIRRLLASARSHVPRGRKPSVTQAD
jgi:peptidoglycan biosynthesis protein MviN/MurJ (putative lipid II flippase)